MSCSGDCANCEVPDHDDELVVTPEDKLVIVYNGQEHKFKHFAPKEENLVKINIKLPDGINEGIWACVSDEDKAKYDDDNNHTDVIIVNLRNTSILRMPWGTLLPATLNGSKRPLFDMELIEDKTEVCYNQVDTVKSPKVDEPNIIRTDTV